MHIYVPTSIFLFSVSWPYPALLQLFFQIQQPSSDTSEDFLILSKFIETRCVVVGGGIEPLSSIRLLYATGLEDQCRDTDYYT